MASIPRVGQVVDRRAEGHGSGDVGRAGLETRRRLGELGLLEGHRTDHFSTALVRRHGAEQLLFAPEDTDSCRAIHLVA